MRATLRAAKIELECLETAKASIKGLGGTIVCLRQDSRPGGGVTANLVVEGEREAIGAIWNLIPVEQLEGITEFGPAETMTGNVDYRIAVPGDEVAILLVFAEVAPEVPTRVYPHTLRRIDGTVATGLSWVAVDVDDKVVGYALAFTHDNTIHLDYLGVSKIARGQHISSALVSKLKEARLPIVTNVRPDNKSSMAERFERFGFVENPTHFDGKTLRWEPEGQ